MQKGKRLNIKVFNTERPYGSANSQRGGAAEEEKYS